MSVNYRIKLNGTSQAATATIPNSSPFTSQGAFRVEGRVRNLKLSGNTTTQRVFFFQGTGNGVRLFVGANSTNLTFSENRNGNAAIVAVSGRTDFLFRAQYDPANSRLTLEVWNADGSNYASNASSTLSTTTNFDFHGLPAYIGCDNTGASGANNNFCQAELDFINWIDGALSLGSTAPVEQPASVTFLTKWLFGNNGNDSAGNINLTLAGSPIFNADLDDSDSASLTSSTALDTGATSKSDTDAATASETVSINVGGSDQATAGDSSALNISASDSSGVSEQASINSSVSSTDSASTAEAVSMAVLANDAGGAGEQSAISATSAASDQASAAETAATQAAEGDADQAVLAEQTTISAAAGDSHGAGLSESAQVQANVTGSDQAATAEATATSAAASSDDEATAAIDWTSNSMPQSGVDSATVDDGIMASDHASVSAGSAATDQAGLSESANIAQNAVDSSAFAESVIVAESLSAADQASETEAANINAAASAGENLHASESTAVSAQVMAEDLAQLSEAIGFTGIAMPRIPITSPPYRPPALMLRRASTRLRAARPRRLEIRK